MGKRQAAKKKLKLQQNETSKTKHEVNDIAEGKKKKKFFNPDSKKNKRSAEEIAKFKQRHKEKLRLAKKAAAEGVPLKKRRKTEIERKKEKAKKARKAALATDS